MARSKASAVRDLAARKCCLNFDQACSIGFVSFSRMHRESYALDSGLDRDSQNPGDYVDCAMAALLLLELTKPHYLSSRAHNLHLS